MAQKRGKYYLAGLKAERKRELAKLLADMDHIQGRLDQLSEFNRHPDDILEGIRKRNRLQFNAEEMLKQNPAPINIHEPNWPLVTAIAFIALLAASVFFFYPQISVTGHAVADNSASGWWDVSDTWAGWKDAWKDAEGFSFSTTTSFIMVGIVIIGLIGAFLAKVEHNHKTRHDRYKHPLMLEKD
ncbi:TPA: hypothetical protein HA265_03845 [Candidatus Woesearchaeota archaeon]|nr:hypothetical protein [Candidatus Woesearchaeota archaeon]